LVALRKQKSIKSDLTICVRVVAHRLASWSSILIQCVGISILIRVDGVFLLINRFPPFLKEAYHRHTICVKHLFSFIFMPMNIGPNATFHDGSSAGVGVSFKIVMLNFRRRSEGQLFLQGLCKLQELFPARFLFCLILFE